MTLPALTDARLDVTGRVATLTMLRHDVRNELTGTALVEDLLAVIGWINSGLDISVLVLTGGGTAFSSGGNIKHMLAREGAFAGDIAEVQRQYRLGIQRLALAMDRLEVPAIAAINGPAIGAGLDLACMCDLRLAASTATMGESFLDVGIIPGDGGAFMLQRLIGYQRAAELTFTARIIGAEEAQRLGLVLEVLPPEELLPRAAALAATIAAKPPQALRLAKRLMKAAPRQQLSDHLDQAALFQGICHRTEDHAEAITAILARRPPEFTGR